MRNLFNRSPRTIGDLVYTSTTHSLGGGEWSQEFYDGEGNYLFEIVGENGTQCSEEEHQWSIQNMEHQEMLHKAELLHIHERIYWRGKLSEENHNPKRVGERR